MSNDLISRSALLESVNYYYTHTPNDSPEHYAYGVALKEIREHPTAFDKEKVIGELKSWEKASHDAGIQSTYAELDNKASGYYQESRAYHRAIEIVEKGGIE